MTIQLVFLGGVVLVAVGVLGAFCFRQGLRQGLRQGSDMGRKAAVDQLLEYSLDEIGPGFNADFRKGYGFARNYFKDLLGVIKETR